MLKPNHVIALGSSPYRKLHGLGNIFHHMTFHVKVSTWTFEVFAHIVNTSCRLVYPLVNIQTAIENGPVEIVDLPSYKMVDLSIVFC